jgi:hypothetical protein
MDTVTSACLRLDMQVQGDILEWYEVAMLLPTEEVRRNIALLRRQMGVLAEIDPDGGKKRLLLQAFEYLLEFYFTSGGW